MSLLRAVLVSLAWFIVSLRPGTDRLTKNLSQTEVTWGEKDENNVNRTVTKENGLLERNFPSQHKILSRQGECTFIALYRY